MIYITLFQSAEDGSVDADQELPPVEFLAIYPGGVWANVGSLSDGDHDTRMILGEVEGGYRQFRFTGGHIGHDEPFGPVWNWYELCSGCERHTQEVEA